MPKVWINKDTLFDMIVVVADDAIVTADVDESSLEETKNRIENGEPPLNVLGEKATMIPYFSIRKAEVNERDTDIEVDYKTDKASESKTLDFIDIDTRKAAFSEIKLQLGDRFSCMTEQYSVMRAVYAPLMTLTIIALVTWVLHGAATVIVGGEEADISGPNSGIKNLFFWALDLLGPMGVLIVGSLLILLAVLFLVKRVQQPLVVTTLKEGEQSPAGVIGTVFRYGILAGVWYLFAPSLFAAVV